MSEQNQNFFKSALYAAIPLYYKILEYFNIDRELFFIYLLLMIIDATSKTILCFAQPKLGKFSSSGYYIGFLKKISLLLAFGSTLLLFKISGYNLHKASGYILLVFMIAEVVSIYSNAIMTRTGVKIEEHDVITSLLIKLKDMLYRTLKFFLDKIEDSFKPKV